MYNCAMESSMRNAILGVCGLLLVTTTMSAQQPPPAGRGQATAPPAINWPSPPLPDGPLMIDTGLVRPIKVTITKGLTQPWSMVFVPEGGGDFTILVAERGGMLRKIRNGALDPSPVDGLPADIQAAGLAGLMDIQLHPKFADNKFVYVCYTKPIDDKRQTTAIARGTWDGNALTGTKDVFVGSEGIGTSRIAFGRDGMLYMSTSSGQGNGAQDPNNQGGKVLRLKDDGSIPTDNPFAGRAGFCPTGRRP